jgi:serine/threonine protein kinase
MFYQILYGYLPWQDNKSINSLLKKIKTEELTFAPSVKLSESLKDLITKMLKFEDEKRISIKEVQV